MRGPYYLVIEIPYLDDTAFVVKGADGHRLGGLYPTKESAQKKADEANYIFEKGRECGREQMPEVAR